MVLVASVANNFRAAKAFATAKQTATRIGWASPMQQAAFEYGPAPLCLSGGYGASKTFACCLKALFISDLFPKNRGVIARNKWVDLKDTTMKTFFKICPPAAYFHGRRSDQQKILQLNNGSEILWLHLDDPEQENVIQGLEINWFLIDQAEETDEEIFDKLSARLGRWDMAQVPTSVSSWFLDHYKQVWPWRNEMTGRNLVPTYAMLTCNPSVLTHWIYRRFHPDSTDYTDRRLRDPEGSGSLVSWRDLGYKMLHMPSLDNKYLPKQNRAQLLARGKSFVARFVEGKWGQVEGTIHEISKVSILEATPEVLHYVFASESNGAGRRFYRTYDHGDASPSCLVCWAMDDYGNHFAYLEYYHPNRLVSKHRREIFKLLHAHDEAYGRHTVEFSGSWADPAIFNKTQQTKGGRYSINDEYEDLDYDPETALYFERGDNDEYGTRNAINELLKMDPEHLNPFTGEKGAPRLYFLMKSSRYPNGCSKLVQETESQRRLKIGTYLGEQQYSDERDPEIVDHAYDVLRYYVAAHNTPDSKIAVRKTAGTFKGAQMLLTHMKRAQASRLDRVALREATRYGRI